MCLACSYDVFSFTTDDLIKHSVVLIKELKVLHSFNITEKAMAEFVFMIRDNYLDNPYHGFRHAVDVLQVTTQSVDIISDFRRCGEKAKLFLHIS